MTFQKTITIKLSLITICILLLISCASAPEGPREMTIAVWDLDDLSPSAYAQQANLGEILSGKIIEAVQAKGEYSVIERQRLLLALEELHLGSSSLADEDTRLKLGKITGASFMIFGGYQIIGDTMRLDLRLVEVETGKIKKAVQKTASASDLAGWLDAAGKAAEELL